MTTEFRASKHLNQVWQKPVDGRTDPGLCFPVHHRHSPKCSSGRVYPHFNFIAPESSFPGIKQLLQERSRTTFIPNSWVPPHLITKGDAESTDQLQGAKAMGSQEQRAPDRAINLYVSRCAPHLPFLETGEHGYLCIIPAWRNKHPHQRATRLPTVSFMAKVMEWVNRAPGRQMISCKPELSKSTLSKDNLWAIM